MFTKSNEVDSNENNNKSNPSNSRNSMLKVAWISTAIAVCVGLIITKNPTCLWAFALLLFL